MAVADMSMNGAQAVSPAVPQSLPDKMDPHSEAAAQLIREKFLPVTRHGLLDRLTTPGSWPDGNAGHARRFMRYLDYWRRHSYSAKLLDLEQTYEPFSPDTDLLHTRTFTADERKTM